MGLKTGWKFANWRISFKAGTSGRPTYVLTAVRAYYVHYVERCVDTRSDLGAMQKGKVCVLGVNHISVIRRTVTSWIKIG